MLRAAGNSAVALFFRCLHGVFTRTQLQPQLSCATCLSRILQASASFLTRTTCQLHLDMCADPQQVAAPPELPQLPVEDPAGLCLSPDVHHLQLHAVH